MLRNAVESGINFFDTAEFYDNYHQLKVLSDYEGIVIITKSYAYTAKMARESVEKALRDLNRDYLDAFCLHEQESDLTLKGHQEALDELLVMKKKGIIRAIGISTHHIAAVRAAVLKPEIEIVQAIVNPVGRGIVDGCLEQMTEALIDLRQQGKGAYAMKILGGGSMASEVREAFTFIRSYPYIDAYALGIGDMSELQLAVEFFFHNRWEEDLAAEARSIQRKVKIADWCTACGNCQEKCSQGAINITGGRAEVDYDKCLICGYCIGVCPELAIKIY